MNQIVDKLHFCWREKRRVFILTVVLAMLLLISFLVNLPGRAQGNSIEDELNLLTGKQEELRNLLSQKRQMQIPLELVRQQPERFWRPDTSGNPAIEFRRKIENAAQQSGMVLKSIGSMQNSKLADGVMCFEIGIQGNAKYSEFLQFMKNMNEDGSGRIFWSALTVTPDNLLAPNYLIVNGNLKTVAVIHPSILELWREEP